MAGKKTNFLIERFIDFFGWIFDFFDPPIPIDSVDNKETNCYE